MIVEVRYKGKSVDKNDIEVTWSDCFGEHKVDSLEGFARDYAYQQAGIEMAGEAW